jgi:hypothetical protein
MYRAAYGMIFSNEHERSLYSDLVQFNSAHKLRFSKGLADRRHG